MVVIKATKIERLFFYKVLGKQETEGLSDYVFADKLGIDRSTWTHTRRGRRPIRLALIKAIARTYPDMHQDIINFLKDGRGHE